MCETWSQLMVRGRFDGRISSIFLRNLHRWLSCSQFRAKRCCDVGVHRTVSPMVGQCNRIWSRCLAQKQPAERSDQAFRSILCFGDGSTREERVLAPCSSCNTGLVPMRVRHN